MPVYRYKALSQSGTVVSGEALSSSEDELTRELIARGYRVQHLANKRAWALPWKSSTVPHLQFSLFVNELTSLLKAGLSVSEALELTAERHGEPTLEKIVLNVLRTVQAGSSLSDAFALHKDKLDELFISVLKTGEKSGNLPAALEQYLVYLGSRIKLQKKLKQAMAYPVFLLVSLLAILGIMFFFVMPRFASMYANFGAKLPAPTQALMYLVSNIPMVAGIAVVALIGSAVALRIFKNNAFLNSALETLRFSLPVIGRTYDLIHVARISRSLAILVSSGTPLLDSLKSVRESLTSSTYAERVSIAEAAILGGNSFEQAISQSRLMPKTAAKLVRAGEASGNLGVMLSEVAEYYQELLETRLERNMALIEPLLILVMGLIVGAVIIIMYLPIFKLAEVV
jgi:type IV pilus assembly protein PilC